MVSPNDIVNYKSVLSIQPDITCIWLVLWVLLLNCTFIQGLQVRCHLLSTSHLNWVLTISDQAIEDFEQSHSFHPHRFCWNTRTGFIMWWVWCHYLCSPLQALLVLFLIILNSTLLLASNHINYGTLLLPIVLAGRMSDSKLICYCPSLCFRYYHVECY